MVVQIVTSGPSHRLNGHITTVTSLLPSHCYDPNKTVNHQDLKSTVPGHRPYQYIKSTVTLAALLQYRHINIHIAVTAKVLASLLSSHFRNPYDVPAVQLVPPSHHVYHRTVICTPLYYNN